MRVRRGPGVWSVLLGLGVLTLCGGVDLTQPGAMAFGEELVRTVERPKQERADPLSDEAWRQAGPIKITSDRMIIHEEERRVIFEGDVAVHQGDLVLRADRLEVWSDDTPSGPSLPDHEATISTIHASGHVEVVHGERHVKADEAVYDHVRQEIVLTGRLSGHDGAYQVAGDRMVIYLQEHRTVIEGSRVIIPGTVTPSQSGNGQSEQEPPP